MMKPVKNRKDRLIAYLKFFASLTIGLVLLTVALLLSVRIPNYIPKESDLGSALLTNRSLDNWINERTKREQCHYIIDAIKEGKLPNGSLLTRVAVAEDIEMIEDLLKSIEDAKNIKTYWKTSARDSTMRFFYIEPKHIGALRKSGTFNLGILKATTLQDERFLLMDNDFLFAERVVKK